METNPSSTPAPAGFTIEEWTRAVRISVAGYYNLRLEDRPRLARIGRGRGKVVILESPVAWLERMAERTQARKQPQPA